MKLNGVLKHLRLSLVSLDWIRQKDPKVSLGHASILAKMYANPSLMNHVDLRSFEFDVQDSFKISTKEYFDEFCEHIANQIVYSDPHLIAFGAFVWNEAHIQRLISILRKEKFNFEGKILIGGPQISYALPGTLEKFYPTVDYFIRGYGERAFFDLVAKSITNPNNAEILSKISGVHVAGYPDLGLQAKNALEDLPSPYLNGVIDLKRSFIRWESQRGCPFRCSFCQHKDNYSNRQHICSKRIQAEIELICDNKTNSQVNDIAVLDPTFNSGSSYLSVLDCFIKNGFKGKLALQTRLEMVNDEFMNKVMDLNKQGARVVLECGIQTIVNAEMKVIRRLNNLKRIEKVSEQLRQRQIEFEVSLIFGLPHQTVDSFKKSLHYCMNTIKPSKIDAWPLMLLRGTELEQSKEKYQLREEIIPTHQSLTLSKERIFIGISHVTSSHSFSKSDWLEMLDISTKLNK
jgi:radical SAM superfamily enzyme YgiQ (UPF0313 family)